MTVFQFILASLACYRLTVLVSRDGCPFDAFKRARKLPLVGKAASCPYCSSVWIAAAIVAGFWFSGIRDSYVVTACIWFALSGVTIILDRCFSADYQG